MQYRRFASTRTAAAGRHRLARPLAALLLSGLLSAAPGCGDAIAQTTPSAGANRAVLFAAEIDEASRRFRVPATWIDAVIRAESAYDIRAVSPAGAIGLMQIMPETWLELSARYGLGSDPFDPRDNILAGTAYLREMHDRYGDITAMLAAYNAGPQRYDDYRAGARGLPAETIAYVAAIAPLLGADTLPATTSSAALDPRAWLSAPLFVGRSDISPLAAGVRPGQQRERAANAAPPLAGDAPPTPPPDLFVRRGGGGGSQ